MSKKHRDVDLAVAAVKLILDGRDPFTDGPEILITLDHTIACVLLMVTAGDSREAAKIFEEGTSRFVIERLTIFDFETRGK